MTTAAHHPSSVSGVSFVILSCSARSHAVVMLYVDRHNQRYGENPPFHNGFTLVPLLTGDSSERASQSAGLYRGSEAVLESFHRRSLSEYGTVQCMNINLRPGFDTSDGIVCSVRTEDR
uniref:Putative secreted protein n=1 Tax=Anopheles darlingi TaxID=43151 RepID=A0A2M4DM36_ANODA